LLVLIASGKFRHRVDAASLGGLCCMVVAGPRTVCVVMGFEIQMISLFAHKRSKLWITCHSRKTWFRILRYYGLHHLTPQGELPFFEWWLPTRNQIHKLQRKGFDSLALLVVWLLWKERNRRVHDRAPLQLVPLAPLILEEARRWAWAGFAGIASLGCLRLRL
jgi:hypothetical protein